MNFSIDAGTYTLKSANKDYKQILRDDANYVIPIYQRPYSWTEDQLNKFISDLFDSYWGADKLSQPEPMFIGTMQLSKIDTNGEQDIIDGQQRLTSFMLFLKTLQLTNPDNSAIQQIPLNWLKTEVNNGKQQEGLQEVISLQSFDDIESDGTNHYLDNILLIYRLYLEEIKAEFDEPTFNLNTFLDHLWNEVYFVVIETYANLSKTLQIFDAINTTGLDLNAGDVFKIRMYEYLNPKGENDKVFNDISALYEKIENYNQKYHKTITDISGILSIYQFYLIAKYKLPKDLYTYSSELFYDRLFETLFKIHEWPHYKGNVENGKIELKLEDIDALIETRYEWEEKWSTGNYGTIEDNAMLYLWWWSRYGRYWTYTFLFLNHYKNDSAKWDKLFVFTKKLVRLYYLYSIYYQKSINDIRAKFNNRLLDLLTHNSYEEVIDYIDAKMNSISPESIKHFKSIISGNINYSSKVKNLLCRLSATIDEDCSSTKKEDILEFRHKLFVNRIDIEHIQSHNDEDILQRGKIQTDWGHHLHSLGNLVALESEINRSINNHEHKKLSGYKESKLIIVRENLVKDYNGWGLEKCLERKENEVKKIMDYLKLQA